MGNPGVRVEPQAPGFLTGFATVLAGALLLCAAAAIEGGPIFYPDTRFYYRAGLYAVEKGLGIVAALLGDPGTAGGGGGEAGGMPASVDDAVRGVAVVRSVYYGIFVYLLHALGSMWLVVVTQAAAASYAVFTFCRLMVAGRAVPVFLATMLGLTLLTSLPWYAGHLTPDIFTGVTALCVAFLAFHRDRLGRLEALAVAALLLAGLVFHPTHLVIGSGLVVVALALKLLLDERGQRRRLGATAAFLGMPIALAVVAGLLVGYVGFHRLTLTPQFPPFLMFRAIADGPGRAWLEEHCPTGGYRICDFADRFSDDATAMLFHPEENIYVNMPPEVRAQLRADQGPVMTGVVRTYPLWLAWTWVKNWGLQLARFGLTDIQVGTAEIAGEDVLLDLREDDEDHLRRMTLISVVHYGVVVVSALILAWRAPLWLDGRRAALGATVMLVLAALLLNALVCGALSAPLHRFQARIIWLLPLLVVPLLLAARRGRGRAAAAAVDRP